MAEGENVVITGISGTFPSSTNFEHLRENLFNKVNMVTENKYFRDNHPEIPYKHGQVPINDKFDAGFFGIHHRQAESMDPMVYQVLEKSVEALLDAGFNPCELEGSRTGVFIGTSNSETESYVLGQNNPKEQSFALSGCMRVTLANRLSYYLKLKGQSYIIDTACASSLAALEHAYRAVKSGECDNALIGGVNLMFHPNSTLHYVKLGMLSPECRCKSFDEDCDGITRSCCAGMLFLQKARNARRIYCNILDVQISSDGYKSEGISVPSREAQADLLRKIYKDCGIQPSEISYLEAHGTGTVVGDFEELTAIGEALCQNITRPLLIGSVKSNLGHCEVGSGLASIAKTIISMETGLIPANLHFETHRKGIAALEKGLIKVVAEHERLKDERVIIGINNFGFGGVNVHAVLQWNMKVKANNGFPEDNLPRLICVSGRTEDSVNHLLDLFKNTRLDAEYLRLFHEVFSKRVQGHVERGFSIISPSSPGSETVRSLQKCTSIKKTLWLIFDDSEVNSNLRSLPAFNASLQRIATILAELTLKNSDLLVNSWMQIALVEIYTLMELKPDYLFGADAVGEILCAFFENCLTLKETVKSLYYLGTDKEKFIECFGKYPYRPKRWQTYKPVSEITADYILGATNNLTNFKSLLISTNEYIAFTNSNNLKIIQEINLKNVIMIHPCERENGLTNFLTALGRLYNLGYEFPTHKLYPEIEFPVSRSTPMIAPHIKWDHRTKWETVLDMFVEKSQKSVGTCKAIQQDIEIDFSRANWQFVDGYTFNGRNIFPFMGLLVIVRETVANKANKIPEELSVAFSKCKILNLVDMVKGEIMYLTVSIHGSSGYFEVTTKDKILVCGHVQILDDETTQYELKEASFSDEVLHMVSDDVYKELQLRGQYFTGVFRQIQKFSLDRSQGLIRWADNLTGLMDNMLQCAFLLQDTRSPLIVSSIDYLLIGGKEHTRCTQENDLVFNLSEKTNTIRCGGIEMRGIATQSQKRKPQTHKALLEKCQFVPYETLLSLNESVRVKTQIIVENLQNQNIKVLEIIANADQSPLSSVVYKTLSEMPQIQPEVVILTPSKLAITCDNVSLKIGKLVDESRKYDAIIVHDTLSSQNDIVQEAFTHVREDGMVLIFEKSSSKGLSNDILRRFAILTTHTTQRGTLYLTRRKIAFPNPVIIDVSDDFQFLWIDEIKKAFEEERNVIIFAQGCKTSGIVSLYNSVRHESVNYKIKCVYINDNSAPRFNYSSAFYKNQIDKCIGVNAYENGKWGTFNYFYLEEKLTLGDNLYFDSNLSKWIEDYKTCQDNNSTNVIEVFCSVVNSGSEELVEFSGKDSNKARVMGLGVKDKSNELVCTKIKADECLLLPIPSQWSMDEAATVPLTYATVLYALKIAYQLNEGSHILVHDGAQPIGMAAINIALSHYCKVYTTVRSNEEEEFVKCYFPELQESQIINRNKSSFPRAILNLTRRKGVVLVINPLKENKQLESSVKCLSKDGVVLQLCKPQHTIDMRVYSIFQKKDIAIVEVQMNEVLIKFKKQLTELLSETIAKGLVRPFPRTVVEIKDLEWGCEQILREDGGRQKLVIKTRQEKNPTQIKGIQLVHFDPEKVQVVIGGLGGFGLELIDWMIKRGARKFVISTTKRGVSNGYQAYKLRLWESYDVFVLVLKPDVTTREGCEELIEQANKMGHVESIFNLAIILRSALMKNQTKEAVQSTYACKVWASKFLDEISSEKCPHLSNFVLFSSTAVRGYGGISSYSMTNSALERLCEKRTQSGLPAVAIEWGPLSEAGIVAKDMKEDRDSYGLMPQRVSNSLELMDSLMTSGSTTVASYMLSPKKNFSDDIVVIVADILGIKDMRQIRLSGTLADHGMDSIPAIEIQKVLELDFQVKMTMEELRNLTFARLREINSQLGE